MAGDVTPTAANPGDPMAVPATAAAVPAGVSGAAGGRASVAAEMEAIFGSGSGGPAPVGPPVAESPLPRAERQGGRGAFVMAGAIVLAAGAGMFAVSHWRPAPPTTSLSPVTKTVALAPPEATRAPPPPVVAPVAAPYPTPAQTASPPAIAATAPPVSVPSRAIPARPARHLRSAAEREPRVYPSGRCAGFGGRRRYACTLDALAAADGRLRRAYDTAVATGVSRRRLLATREEWSMLRGDARYRPLWVVARYDELAAGLEAASSRAR